MASSKREHREVVSDELGGQMVLLGTGTSVGVPAIGCRCAVCQSDDPKHHRLRASAILGLPEGNLLIDTSPDLRQQLLREKIGLVHAVTYTHEHADHVMGFDDLRLFPFSLGRAVPVYCNQVVESRLHKSFDYAFADLPPTHAGGVPSVELIRIDKKPVEILGATVIPIPLKHGPRFEVLGFRVGNVAYCTDVNEIPDGSRELLGGLDVLVLDALRPQPHVTHFNVEQALEVVEQLKPKQTWFTHCSCRMDYTQVNPTLPSGVQVGYDGLRIPLT